MIVNNEIKKIGLKIEGKIYYFHFGFNLICKLERKYNSDNAISIINQFLMRINTEENFIKLLCASCINYDLDEEYLKEHISFNKQILNIYTTLTTILFKGYGGQLKTAVDLLLKVQQNKEFQEFLLKSMEEEQQKNNFKNLMERE